MKVSEFLSNLLRKLELTKLLEEDINRLADRISRAGANLLGTRPYWLARRTELKAMIKDLHCPHLFITFSAADVQWPDLHHHMPSQLPLNATEQERARI